MFESEKKNVPCKYTVLVAEDRDWCTFNLQVKSCENIHYRYLSFFCLLIYSINTAQQD